MPWFTTQIPTTELGNLFPQKLGDLANDTLLLTPSLCIPQPKIVTSPNVLPLSAGSLNLVTTPLP